MSAYWVPPEIWRMILSYMYDPNQTQHKPRLRVPRIPWWHSVRMEFEQVLVGCVLVYALCHENTKHRQHRVHPS